MLVCLCGAMCTSVCVSRGINVFICGAHIQKCINLSVIVRTPTDLIHFLNHMASSPNPNFILLIRRKQPC